MIWASGGLLMHRPELWPPLPTQLEDPEDWRLPVLTRWSDFFGGFYFLALQDDPPRPVTCGGRIVAFLCKNALGRAFLASNEWTTGWAHRRRQWARLGKETP